MVFPRPVPGCSSSRSDVLATLVEPWLISLFQRCAFVAKLVKVRRDCWWKGVWGAVRGLLGSRAQTPASWGAVSPRGFLGIRAHFRGSGESRALSFTRGSRERSCELVWGVVRLRGRLGSHAPAHRLREGAVPFDAPRPSSSHPLIRRPAPRAPQPRRPPRDGSRGRAARGRGGPRHRRA